MSQSRAGLRCGLVYIITQYLQLIQCDEWMNEWMYFPRPHSGYGNLVTQIIQYIHTLCIHGTCDIHGGRHVKSSAKHFFVQHMSESSTRMARGWLLPAGCQRSHFRWPRLFTQRSRIKPWQAHAASGSVELVSSRVGGTLSCTSQICAVLLMLYLLLMLLSCSVVLLGWFLSLCSPNTQPILWQNTQTLAVFGEQWYAELVSCLCSEPVINVIPLDQIILSSNGCDIQFYIPIKHCRTFLYICVELLHCAVQSMHSTRLFCISMLRFFSKC